MWVQLWLQRPYLKKKKKLSIFTSKWLTIIPFTIIRPQNQYIFNTQNATTGARMISYPDILVYLRSWTMVLSSHLQLLERKALWSPDPLVICTLQTGRHPNERDRSQMSWILNIFTIYKEIVISTHYLLVEFPLKQYTCSFSSTHVVSDTCVNNSLENAEK